MMEKSAKIYVAGHRGMVGSAIVRELNRQGYENLVLRTHRELDLTCQAAVNEFFETEKPEYVFMPAGKVGGIVANQKDKAGFLYENEMMALNVIHAAWVNGVKKFEYLGSSCIYPRMAPQPMKESFLLTSALEETNEGYALAKISGLKYCEYLNRQYGAGFISLMPTNLYGPGDNYDIVHGHVLPTMIRKFETARESGAESVPLWGSGSPLREFLHVDDLAAACLFALELENPPDLMNVGSGEEVTIRELAEAVKAATGSTAKIEWDATKPDGTPRKLCDTALIRSLGWKPAIDLKKGLELTVASSDDVTIVNAVWTSTAVEPCPYESITTDASLTVEVLVVDPYADTHVPILIVLGCYEVTVLLEIDTEEYTTLTWETIPCQLTVTVATAPCDVIVRTLVEWTVEVTTVRRTYRNLV